MRYVILTLFTILVGSSGGQETLILDASADNLLVAEPDRAFMRPRWSPDGNKIAFTGLNRAGLYVINADGTGFRMLSSEPGAGNNFFWSPDSRHVAAEVAVYRNNRRMNRLQVFDAEKRPAAEIGPAGEPGAIGLHGFLSEGYLLTSQAALPALIASGITAPNDITAVDAQRQRMLMSPGADMIIYHAGSGSSRKLDPVPGARYLTPVLSPDGRSVAFRVYGDQLYAYDIDGMTLQPLGEGHHPRWSYDGKWIIIERSRDDGHNITAADLYIIDPAGSQFIRITATEEVLEVNPDWSPVADRIVYEDLAAGTIHILDLSGIR